METYARQTRTAVTVIAWVVGLSFALTLVAGIIIGVELGKVSGNLNTLTSNCQSQGGTNASC